MNITKSATIALTGSFIAAATLGVGARGQASPTIEQVMERAGRYVMDYAEKMTLVTSTEEYAQWMESSSAVRPINRMLVSEFVLVRAGDDWIGFRDVHTVDAKPVADRMDRLQKLFLESPTTAIRQARQIADESARHNLGPLQRNFNTPTMALYFLQPRNQARFSYKKAGEDTVAGIAVWKVRYEEKTHPTIIRTSAGKDMPVSGTFWIDPAEGRVLKSHMQIASDAKVAGTSGAMDQMGASRATWPERTVHSSASITVNYKVDEHLGMLVPGEMLETYESPRPNALSAQDGVARVNCRATYGDFKRFAVTTNWIVK
jgi:hypothetical protein